MHRAPLWLKGGLFFGLFIVLAVTDWHVALVALVASALCALWAGVAVSQLWLVVRTLALLLLIMGVYYVLTGQYASGMDAIARAGYADSKMFADIINAANKDAR